MTERSRLWTTNNTGDGPSAGYTAADWEKLLRHWLQAGDEANGGVLFGIGSELAVSGASSPVAVAAGAAIVYGHYYENDASLNLAVTTPVVGTTGGHIVLRVNYAAQTVRAVAVRNTDGVNSTPARTQSAGTTWEIRLASFTITTGGVITLTDTRKYAKYSAKVYGDQLDSAIAGNGLSYAASALAVNVDGSTLEISSDALRVKDAGITAAKLAAAVAGNGLSGGAGTALAVNVDGTTLEINADALRVKDAGISSAKVASGIPILTQRQGGSATDWFVSGTTTRSVANSLIQVGYNLKPNDGAGTYNVTFPTAFSDKPLVFLQNLDGSGVTCMANPVTASGFVYAAYDSGGASRTIGSLFFWLAIGPRA